MRKTLGIMLILAVTVPAAADLYVATTGDDSTGTGTQANPYLTIQKAVWEANAGAESVINVAAGTYAGFWNESEPTNPDDPEMHGENNATKSITVRSYDNDTFGNNWKNTVIDQPTACASLFEKGVEVLDRPVFGFNPYGQNDDGTGTDFIPWAAQRGPDFTYVLEGFTVLGGWDYTELAGWDENEAGVTFVAGVTDSDLASDLPVTVRNCVITGFAGQHGHSSNPFSWNRDRGVAGGQHGHVLVENCLVYGNEVGVSPGANGGSATIKSSTIADNTISGVSSTHSGPVSIENSIIWGNTARDFENHLGNPTFDVTYSDFIYDPDNVGGENCCGGGNMTLVESDNISSDPLFVGGGGAGGYQISGASPAKGAGRDGVDMGAHEALGLASTVSFKRGDPDGSGVINITDGVFILNFLFDGGPGPGCVDSGDVDDSGEINVTDGVFILNVLFSGGPNPPAPYPDCGEDTTGEAQCEAAQAACAA